MSEEELIPEQTYYAVRNKLTGRFVGRRYNHQTATHKSVPALYSSKKRVDQSMQYRDLPASSYDIVAVKLVELGTMGEITHECIEG